MERIHFGHEWVDPAHPVEERVLPDGGVHLIFNPGDPPAVPGHDGAASVAVGARCAPSIIYMAGRVEHVTVTLRPGGMAALLGVPAAELAAHDVPLDALWGPRAAEALERLSAAPPTRARAAAMESVLLEMLAARPVRPDPAAAEAVRRIERARGRIRVRELAAALGLERAAAGAGLSSPRGPLAQVGVPYRAVPRHRRPACSASRTAAGPTWPMRAASTTSRTW